jgi:uncharacterized membrane protein YedE/YeeE
MADRIEKTRTVEPVDNRSSRTTEVREVTEASPTPATVLERIVWWITWVILALLGLRFILALLGANPANAFANFIYSTSHPLVAPFFSLFNYNMRYGISRFEIYTLIAMLVYALIGYGIVALIRIGRPSGRNVAHTA